VNALALVAYLLTVGLLAWLLRGRTLYLHGAEHRAIAAAEAGRLSDTWDGAAAPSRFSLRCGTNFVALVLPVSLLADRLWPFAPTLWTPVLVALLTLGLFLFVINALMFWAAAGVLGEGFRVAGFGAALIGSLIYSLCGMVIDVAMERLFDNRD